MNKYILISMGGMLVILTVFMVRVYVAKKEKRKKKPKDRREDHPSQWSKPIPYDGEDSIKKVLKPFKKDYREQDEKEKT